MGIQLDIFSLYQLGNEHTNCQHFLLIKVEQPSFNNSDESDYAKALDTADEKKSALIALYESVNLADECPCLHHVKLVGELQAYPSGDVLFDEYGGFYVDLWTADTRFGHPWMILGTAQSEEAFWQEVDQDENLSQLGGIKPAKKQRTYFLTEKRSTIREGICLK
jgi:hypothetical protein